MRYKIASAIAILLAVLLVGGVGYGVWQKVQEERADAGGGGERQSVVAVEVRPVELGEISNIRTFTGTLEPSSSFTVAPMVSGRLERLHVDLGDEVARGQLVAELDDAERVQEVEQATAELAVARANLDEVRSSLAISEREYERFRTLREQQIASESELDAAQSQYEARRSQLRVAEAQVSQREAAMEAARVRQSYTRIHATWDGGSERRVVGERFRDQGDVLAANAAIISLLDIDTLRAVIYVAERDYPNVAVGRQSTVMTDAYPHREFQAEVVRVAPQFQRGSRQARIELALPNDEHLLKPGMFVRVRLEVGRSDEAVLVPLAAVVRREGREGVFLADEAGEVVTFVPVQIGFTQGNRVQVVEPPLEGRVVTLGQHLLSDASRIRIATPEGEAGSEVEHAVEEVVEPVEALGSTDN